MKYLNEASPPCGRSPVCVSGWRRRTHPSSI